MSEAIERFAAFLQLSDEFLARAEREDLEECVRILAVQCAHYRSQFDELPMSDTLEVVARETMNDEQAKWIGDGLEMLGRRGRSTKEMMVVHNRPELLAKEREFLRMHGRFYCRKKPSLLATESRTSEMPQARSSENLQRSLRKT